MKQKDMGSLFYHFQVYWIEVRVQFEQIRMSLFSFQMPGAAVLTALTLLAALRASLEPQTVGPVSVMFWDGWTLWPADCELNKELKYLRMLFLSPEASKVLFCPVIFLENIVKILSWA